jgi:thiamine-phosphate pyrophosphorylase
LTLNSTAPLLYLITDRSRLSSRSDQSLESVIDFTSEAIAAGVDMVQIRERDLTARNLLAISDGLAQTAQRHGAKVLINDRADVAEASGAGVHLTTRSMTADVIRKSFGPEMLVGVSTHSLREAAAAEEQGADFIVFGPVFETESKEIYGPPVGPRALRSVASRLQIPVLALGGVKLTNFRQTLDCGAAGIAAISLFTDTADLQGLVREIKSVQCAVRSGQLLLEDQAGTSK